MSPELERKLKTDFPYLYAELNTPYPTTSLMSFGIDCDDGWFNILYDASAKIEAEILKEPADYRAAYRAEQIKEKFGGIRLYMLASNDRIESIIRELERQSFNTCEFCGSPGTATENGRGWIKTVCEDCIGG